MIPFAPFRALGLAALISWAPGAVWAASGRDAQVRTALGVLKTECITCHGEQKTKGGLSLLTHEAVLKGGDEGPVLVPGRPDESRLFTVLKDGADPHMPPRKQLDPGQLKAIRDWIRGGAGWDPTVFSEEDIPEPVALAPLPQSHRPVLALAVSPDGTRLAVGRGGRLEVYDLAADGVPLRAAVEAHPEGVQSLAWNRDGKSLASGAFRSVRLWDAATLQAQREITNGLTGRITALEFAPGDAALAVADGGNGRPGRVRLFDPGVGGTGAPLTSWRAHADTVFDLEFSRDGKTLLSAGGDQLIRIWKVENHEPLAVLEGHTAQVLSAAFNTNATLVVSGGADRQLKVWDIATREKIISLGNPSAAVAAVAWPADSSAVVAATESGGVYRYTQLKSHTGEQSSASGDERHLGDLPETALSLACSPDGRRIAVGAQDGTVRVWNEEGKLLADLRPPAVVSVPPAPAGPPAKDRARTAPPSRSASEPVAAKVRWKSSQVVSLTAEPSKLELSLGAPQRGIRITARTADGWEVDVTREAKYSTGRRSPVRVSGAGDIIRVTPGEGMVTARLAGREVQVPVTVKSEAPDAEVAPSFVRDVLPALNQAGCSTGGCHAKPEGQNGFKLTVFSYDPRADYAEIVKEARGRRVFPAAPDESLLLQKPLGRVTHEGGRRFEAGSETHGLLVNWLRSGMPFQGTNEPVLQRISVFPKERRYRKQTLQPLLVEAHYSDGSVRDVTRLAAYESNDREMARVDASGRITVGTLTGQGVVVARYMGFVDDAKILVPAERVLPPESYAALPVNNFIDRQAYEQFQRLGLFPSELCTDAEFLRRAKLDSIGLLPTAEEVREFQADTSPDKRRRWIARIVDDPAFADHWANKWADLLRPNPDRVGVKSVFLLDQWLRERFRANEPYDQFVREILLSEGSNHRDGPAVVYRDRREPAELTTMFSQLFLGTRLECAKCHHHPNEKWSQDDFYQFAAFFGPVRQKGAGLSPPISAGTETFYFASGGTVKHPVTGAVMTPKAPDGPAPAAGDGDPRVALADWLTDPANPFFARAAVNRVWAVFFGRGLVHPVDDFRSSNPCVNPGLLDALAADFAAHRYDLKHLVRTILESRLYQLSTEPNDTNVADTRSFSRAYRRRLPAEVLMDAVREATGVPDTFAAVPAGGRANQAWSYKIESHFLDAFGRPNSSSDCPCERDSQLSVVQTLHLMNSRALQAKLADPAGRVRTLAAGDRPPAEVVTELYRVTLSRNPTDAELKAATAAFTAEGATRQSATEDVMWSLLNSPEFLLNH